MFAFYSEIAIILSTLKRKTFIAESDYLQESSDNPLVTILHLNRINLQTALGVFILNTVLYQNLEAPCDIL